MSMFKLDHLAISTTNLAEGAEDVAERLGVALDPGGVHALMGTHNQLLSLGPDLYLEVIAIDPAAGPPAQPRWFALDQFDGRTQLTNWVVATDNLVSALQTAPDGTGDPMKLSRGDLEWEIAVPADGHLPYDACFPALIQWRGGKHPATRLPDRGCRLHRLHICHPRASQIAESLPGFNDPRVMLSDGPIELIAEIDTPSGRKLLP